MELRPSSSCEKAAVPDVLLTGGQGRAIYSLVLAQHVQVGKRGTHPLLSRQLAPAAPKNPPAVTSSLSPTPKWRPGSNTGVAAGSKKCKNRSSTYSVRAARNC